MTGKYFSRPPPPPPPTPPKCATGPLFFFFFKPFTYLFYFMRNKKNLDCSSGFIQIILSARQFCFFYHQLYFVPPERQESNFDWKYYFIFVYRLPFPVCFCRFFCRIKDWPKWLVYTWVGHGKRPEPEGCRSFTMANPGKKKHFGQSFVVYQ